MAPAPGPVTILDGALPDGVGVDPQQRREVAAGWALVRRHRAEHGVERAAQLPRPLEVAVGPHGGGQRAGAACPRDEVGVAPQVVLLRRGALDGVGEVEREIAAPELDGLDRPRYHRRPVYP